MYQQPGSGVRHPQQLHQTIADIADVLAEALIVLVVDPVPGVELF